jgi:predicted enzyme related to lactoylglutathione lyase
MATQADFVFTLEYVSDVEAAKKFFVDALKLEVERAAPTFVQFKDRNGAAFAISSDEAIGTGGQEVYWSVGNAETALQDLSQESDIIVPLTQLPFGKVFGVKDPAGQPHYFVEFVDNRPSQ